MVFQAQLLSTGLWVVLLIVWINKQNNKHMTTAEFREKPLDYMVSFCGNLGWALVSIETNEAMVISESYAKYCIELIKECNE